MVGGVPSETLLLFSVAATATASPIAVAMLVAAATSDSPIPTVSSEIVIGGWPPSRRAPANLRVILSWPVTTTVTLVGAASVEQRLNGIKLHLGF